MDFLLYTTLPSPLGELLLCRDARGLRVVHMLSGPCPRAMVPEWRLHPESFVNVAEQLEEYFAGARRNFELSLAPEGNAFEQAVWQALTQIPYGATATYGEIATAIGHPGGARAVGSANARNPLAVIVPCHRVIGSDGALTGYGGGLERKRLLLDLEAGVQPLSPAGGLASSTRPERRSPQIDA
ncbi:MAG: methylated-DNA--[protein]-cysteine S-methyltransferase [Solirubrobacteraceae bacterium]